MERSRKKTEWEKRKFHIPLNYKYIIMVEKTYKINKNYNKYKLIGNKIKI